MTVRLVPLLLLVFASLPLFAQSPPTRRLEVPYRQFTLPNGLNVILHRDTQRAGRRRQRLVPRRLGQRAAGPHRLRAPVRAPDVRGLEERRRRASSTRCSRPPAATTTARRTTTGPTTYIDVPANALELALFLESDRMGYLLDTMSPERVERPARRRQERAAAELREPALRHGLARARQDAVAGRASLQLADDRPHGRPDRRQPRGRRRVLQEVLRARTTPAWSSPATSTSTARGRWSRSGSARCPRGAAGRAGRAAAGRC